jgi:hypothetical protein
MASPSPGAGSITQQLINIFERMRQPGALQVDPLFGGVEWQPPRPNFDPANSGLLGRIPPLFDAPSIPGEQGVTWAPAESTGMTGLQDTKLEKSRSQEEEEDLAARQAKQQSGGMLDIGSFLKRYMADDDSTTRFATPSGEASTDDTLPAPETDAKEDTSPGVAEGSKDITREPEAETSLPTRTSVGLRPEDVTAAPASGTSLPLQEANPYRDPQRMAKLVRGMIWAGHNPSGALQVMNGMANQWDEQQAMALVPHVMARYKGRNLGDGAVLRQVYADMMTTRNPKLVQLALTGLEKLYRDERAQKMAGAGNVTGFVQIMREIGAAKELLRSKDPRQRQKGIDMLSGAEMQLTAKTASPEVAYDQQMKELTKLETALHNSLTLLPEEKAARLRELKQERERLQKQFAVRQENRPGQTAIRRGPEARTAMVQELRAFMAKHGIKDSAAIGQYLGRADVRQLLEARRAGARWDPITAEELQ